MDIETVLPRDAIPSIDHPSFGAEYLGEDDDDVIVLETEIPRAYPVRILSFHEIVNDEVEEGPIAVTWCPLCGSAIVYDRQVDGMTLTFGVSGKLADDDLVMYDRETESEWKQSLGTCITGELKGTELSIRPAAMMTWREFRSQFPTGLVLQPAHTKSEAASDTDEPADVDYAIEPYDAYFESDGFGLAAHRDEAGQRAWDRNDIAPKTIVLGVTIGNEAVGFPQPAVVNEGGLVRTTVGGAKIIVVAVDGQLHAFEDPGVPLTIQAGVIEGNGTTWNPVTGKSPDGRQLERVPTRRLFAFTWQDDHGADAFFRTDD